MAPTSLLEVSVLPMPEDDIQALAYRTTRHLRPCSHDFLATHNAGREELGLLRVERGLAMKDLKSLDNECRKQKESCAA